MILSSLKWMLERLEQYLKDARDREAHAVEALLTALIETNLYLKQLRNDISAASEDKEANLSHMWREAAQAVRPYDDDLYCRCLAKACRWSGSEEFKETTMADVNIRIEKMIKLAKDFLAKTNRE